jgi:PAS domain S-box-containing protein
MSQPLRLLMVEDSRDDADQLINVLRPAGYEPAYEMVDTSPSMRKALKSKNWDLITADCILPQFSGPEALTLAKELSPETPFIVVTGDNDINRAISLMKAGAKDFIRQQELNRIVPTVAEVLREVQVERDRKSADQALRASESRYRRLFDTAQDGILILDAESGKITEVNPYMIKLLGYPLEEFIGKKLWEIGTFKDSDASKSAFLTLQAQGYVRYDDLPLEASDRRRIDVEFVSNVYMVDDHKVIQCNIRNITRRKQVEAKVRHLNHELEQRLVERVVEVEELRKQAIDLDYSISQGFGTSARRISSLAKALENGHSYKLDAEGQKLIDKIRISVDQMACMLDGLTEVARCSFVEVHQRPVNLSALARRVAAGLRLSDPRRNVEFVIAEGITVNGDPQLLRKVLENLLDNAFKFTATSSAPRIEFGVASQLDGRRAFFVRDNGVGLDMAQSERLFSAFQPVHPDHELPGIGVGLATVERIIRRHGGEVWGEGAENTGATFYFTLGPKSLRLAPQDQVA